MAGNKLFGTDGIRGEAGTFLTPQLALAAAQGFAKVLGGGRKGKEPQTVVLGCDPRMSSPMLVSAIQSGLTSMGFDVLELGVVPTPVVPYIVLGIQAAGGVMVTASHNPIGDNGVKFFNKFGFKLKPVNERVIERFIASSGNNPLKLNSFGDVSQVDANEEYLRYLDRAVRKSGGKRKLKIVLDCAHGATSELAPLAFESHGHKVTTICAEFDGKRINVNCGATELGKLGRAVRKQKADLGLAFDGDGDRVLAVDHTGKPVTGDKIIALFATKLKRYRDQGAVVMTRMTNMGVEDALRHLGIKMVRTEVGDIKVLAGMQGRGLSLGGEQSGHIIMLDKAVSGDGILSGLQLAAIIASSKNSLSELVAPFNEYPQLLSNLKVKDKVAWQKSARLKTKLADIKSTYSDVRFYLRPSGTENVVRVLTESKDADLCRQSNAEVCQAIQAWGRK